MSSAKNIAMLAAVTVIAAALGWIAAYMYLATTPEDQTQYPIFTGNLVEHKLVSLLTWASQHIPSGAVVVAPYDYMVLLHEKTGLTPLFYAPSESLNTFFLGSTQQKPAWTKNQSPEGGSQKELTDETVFRETFVALYGSDLKFTEATFQKYNVSYVLIPNVTEKEFVLCYWYNYLYDKDRYCSLNVIEGTYAINLTWLPPSRDTVFFRLIGGQQVPGFKLVSVFNCESGITTGCGSRIYEYTGNS